jgi:hypothetical protein
MNIEQKYNKVSQEVKQDLKSMVLTPKYIFNKYRTETGLDKLNNFFLGVHTARKKKSKYIVTLFVSDFKTKSYIREEMLIDNNYKLIDVITTRS